MVKWLLVVDIRTVEKESMGIYWVPLCEILVSRGIEFFWSMLGTPKTCPAERLILMMPIGCNSFTATALFAEAITAA